MAQVEENMLIERPHWERARVIQMSMPSRWMARLAVALGACFVIGPILLMFVPWQQNLRGIGRVIAFAPLERQQPIEAPIDGRIVNWWVQEGSAVTAGDPLVEISDIDPNLIGRLEQEKSAVQAKLLAYEGKVRSYEDQILSLEATRDLAIAAAKFRLETGKQRVRSAEESLAAASASLVAAEAQFERHENLLADGIVSERQYEVAERDLDVAAAAQRSAEASLAASKNDQQALEADLQKIRADAQAKIESSRASLNESRGQAEDARASLAKMEVRLSRQRSQLVTAPRSGSVFRLVANQGGEIVKAGDALLVLVPETEDRAVELWVDGVDAPLISAGSTVRLQFEGWPAIQFGGWPSVAIGSFAGEVALVDATDDGQGRFRMLVVPDETDETWPEARFLRQGVRAKGWILLNRVSLGYEIWRQLNGFPPVINPPDPPSDVARKRIK